jgi:hypothetical protein
MKKDEKRTRILRDKTEDNAKKEIRELGHIKDKDSTQFGFSQNQLKKNLISPGKNSRKTANTFDG